MATNMYDVQWEQSLVDEEWARMIQDDELLEKLEEVIKKLESDFGDTKFYTSRERIAVVSGLSKLSEFSIFVSEENPNFSEILKPLIPLPDDEYWEGKNYPSIYMLLRRTEQEGLISYVSDGTGNKIGITLEPKGLWFAKEAKVLDLGDLARWTMTDGLGFPEEVKKKKRKKAPNSLAQGSVVDHDINYLETSSDNPVLGVIHSRSRGWVQMGLFTSAGVSEEMSESTTAVGRVVELINGDKAEKCLNWLPDYLQLMLTVDVVRMCENYSISDKNADLIAGDIYGRKGSLLNHLVNEWEESEHSDSKIAEREIRDLILRITWNLVRSVMDYRMNDHRYAQKKQSAVSGEKIEEFIHRVALAQDVHFETVTGVDGKRKAYDVILDGVGYDLGTLTEKRGNHDQ